MPTYDYACDACGHEFEEFQSITAAPLKKCPKCGRAKLQRLIGTGGGVIFKGSGFYETDYRSESYKKAAEQESGAGKEAAKGEAAAAKADGAAKSDGSVKSDGAGAAAAKGQTADSGARDSNRDAGVQKKATTPGSSPSGEAKAATSPARPQKNAASGATKPARGAKSKS